MKNAGGSSAPYIRYNQDVLPWPVGADFFSPISWQEKGHLVGQAQGRVNAYAIVYLNKQFFLRHYQRGGLFAPLLGDFYLWTGLSSTRAWREFDLLAHMLSSGLPVPRPVAAMVKYKKCLYQADIVTECIPNASTLARLIRQDLIDGPLWKKIGSCIKRFHDHGVFHADLNAQNILIDKSHKVWLIDFDRGFQNHLKRRQKKSNLYRLHRSLSKIWQGKHTDQHKFQSWKALLIGYTGPDTSHDPCP